MAGELTEDSWTRLSVHLVASSALSGAAVGYFTPFVPFQWPADVLGGAIAGGLFFGLLPALAFRRWYLQADRGGG